MTLFSVYGFAPNNKLKIMTECHASVPLLRFCNLNFNFTMNLRQKALLNRTQNKICLGVAFEKNKSLHILTGEALFFSKGVV